MNYAGIIIRPPSEANSIILQVTVGCSWNKCTFCGAYKDRPFLLKAAETVDADLQFAQKYCRRQRRLFLADGDALILSQRRLETLLDKIRSMLPWVTKISLYGNARAVRSKSVEQLSSLKKMGLDRVYMGLESGCNSVLKFVNKGETAQSMIDAAAKVKEAGLFLSLTVLLGLGGSALSRQHAVQTADALNHMAPQQIAALTLMPLACTPLGQAVAAGTFTLLSPMEILQELHLLISHLHGTKCQFHANHASTYLPLAGRLPRDKEVFLSSLADAIDGGTHLVPECRRAL